MKSKDKFLRGDWRAAVNRKASSLACSLACSLARSLDCPLSVQAACTRRLIRAGGAQPGEAPGTHVRSGTPLCLQVFEAAGGGRSSFSFSQEFTVSLRGPRLAQAPLLGRISFGSGTAQRAPALQRAPGFYLRQGCPRVSREEEREGRSSGPLLHGLRRQEIARRTESDAPVRFDEHRVRHEDRAVA